MTIANTYRPNAVPDPTETDATLCFVAGTQIATPGGEVPVEQLAPGNKVMTINGIARRIVWIGVGKVLAGRGQRGAATPVIIRSGALDTNVPCRDLRVTKGHALFIDGVLIPVEELINQRSILWDDRPQELEIYHIELTTHDVLLADGAPAESYRDDGNRILFQNKTARKSPSCGTPCAPLLASGPMVDGIWRRLLDRATSHRMALTSDADVHLVADGVRVDAVAREGDRYVFRLPAAPRTIRIRSRSAVPQNIGVARDPRPLGVAVRQIILGGPHTPLRAARADDARLKEGFHAYEPQSGIRWTNGDAVMPATMLAHLAGPLLCTLELGATTRYLDESRTLRAA